VHFRSPEGGGPAIHPRRKELQMTDQKGSSRLIFLTELH
jgi:hypothetical protein